MSNSNSCRQELTVPSIGCKKFRYEAPDNSFISSIVLKRKTNQEFFATIYRVRAVTQTLENNQVKFSREFDLTDQINGSLDLNEANLDGEYIEVRFYEPEKEFPRGFSGLITYNLSGKVFNPAVKDIFNLMYVRFSNTQFNPITYIELGDRVQFNREIFNRYVNFETSAGSNPSNIPFLEIIKHDNTQPEFCGLVNDSSEIKRQSYVKTIFGRYFDNSITHLVELDFDKLNCTEYLLGTNNDVPPDVINPLPLPPILTPINQPPVDPPLKPPFLDEDIPFEEDPDMSIIRPPEITDDPSEVPPAVEIPDILIPGTPDQPIIGVVGGGPVTPDLGDIPVFENGSSGNIVDDQSRVNAQVKREESKRSNFTLFIALMLVIFLILLLLIFS